METSSETPSTHLDPSDLGTKEYWDNYYQNDLDNQETDGEGQLDPSELESWFDDVGAPGKTLAFLSSSAFSLSPESRARTDDVHPTVLDVGTGNGSALFSLRIEGGYEGPMVGVDYSDRSIELARNLWKQYTIDLEGAPSDKPEDIAFEVFDVIRDDPRNSRWWPLEVNGFDLVLDKGTFDAISLSAETVRLPNGVDKRISDLYPERIAKLVKPEGFFLITSCNWTQEEIINWFTKDAMQGVMEVYNIIQYPVFRFGGQKGQGVVSICFRKISPT